MKKRKYTAEDMARASRKAQIIKYGGLEGYKKEMRRRGKLAKGRKKKLSPPKDLLLT